MTLLISRPAAALGAAALTIALAAPALAQDRFEREGMRHHERFGVQRDVVVHPRHRAFVRTYGPGAAAGNVAGAVTAPGYGYGYRAAYAPGAYGYAGGYGYAPGYGYGGGYAPGYGYGGAYAPSGYGYGFGGPIGAAVAAPFNLAGALLAAPFAAVGGYGNGYGGYGGYGGYAYPPGYGVGTIEETPAVYQYGAGYGFNRGPFGP